jgi:hypothetical protein
MLPVLAQQIHPNPPISLATSGRGWRVTGRQLCPKMRALPSLFLGGCTRRPARDTTSRPDVGRLDAGAVGHAHRPGVPAAHANAATARACDGVDDDTPRCTRVASCSPKVPARTTRGTPHIAYDTHCFGPCISVAWQQPRCQRPAHRDAHVDHDLAVDARRLLPACGSLARRDVDHANRAAKDSSEMSPYAIMRTRNRSPRAT